MCATYKRHLARLGQQTISTTAVETLCRISIASGRFRVEGKPKRTHEYIISTNATSKDWCKFRQLLLHQYLAPATTTPQPLVRSLRSLAPAGPPPSSTNSTETPTTRQVGAISQPPPRKFAHCLRGLAPNIIAVARSRWECGQITLVPRFPSTPPSPSH